MYVCMYGWMDVIVYIYASGMCMYGCMYVCVCPGWLWAGWLAVKIGQGMKINKEAHNSQLTTQN